MKIAVVGAGAMGSIFGARFAQAGTTPFSSTSRSRSSTRSTPMA